MKKLMLLLAGVFALGAAKAQLSGTIAGAEGKKLYLFDDEDNTPNDSLVIKGGRFAFDVKPAKEPGVYALILEGVDFPLLFVPGGAPQQLQLNAKDFPIAAKVQGNDDTRAMQAYQLAFKPLIQRAQELNAEAAGIAGDNEAAKEAFRKKAAAFSKDVVDTGRRFIQQHPRQLASLWMLINELRPRLEPQEFEQLFRSTDKSLQQSKYGQRINEYLASLKASGIGAMAEDFEQQDVDGKKVKLSSFRGKYVLVDFWASWCGPCRAENPNVVKAYNRFKNKNFTILGVSLDDSRARWIGAIREDGLAWTQVSDLQGWRNQVAVQYNIRSIPSNILVDPKGRIIARNLRGGELEARLEKILN